MRQIIRWKQKSSENKRFLSRLSFKTLFILHSNSNLTYTFHFFLAVQHMESVQWQRRFLHNTMFKTAARVFPTCIEELSASLNRDGILEILLQKYVEDSKRLFFSYEYFNRATGIFSQLQRWRIVRFINNERKVMEEESYMCTREIHTLPMYFPNGIPVSHLFA